MRNPDTGELVPVSVNNAAWITANVYLYTGEQFDPDLGFYYLRARYHHPDTGRFWTMDSFEGWNRDPLTLHKYLYCRDNPITRVDPTGRFDLSFSLAGFSMRNVLRGVGWITALAYVFDSVRNSFSGEAPTEDELSVINRARGRLVGIFTSALPYDGYALTAMTARIRIHRGLNLTEGWAWSKSYANFLGPVIHLDERTLRLHPRFLASVLMHEAVHIHQWKLDFSPDRTQGEKEPYQVESDTLRLLRVDGTRSQLHPSYPGAENEEFINEMAADFREAHVVVPAIRFD